jgi:hypothetical protein
MEVPCRHDLSEFSIIDEEIRKYSRKLGRIANKYKHTTLISVEPTREYYTRHGLHIRNCGKDKIISSIITKRIGGYQWKIKAVSPISLVGHDNSCIMPSEKHNEAKPELLTQLPTRLRKNPATRSNDFFVDVRPDRSKIGIA